LQQLSPCWPLSSKLLHTRLIFDPHFNSSGLLG
jgi:hypothetical protein